MGEPRSLSNGRVDFAAGRGYDKREYLPFGVSFEDNQSIFDEASSSCASCGRRRAHSHNGKHYQFEDVRITPKPCSSRFRPMSRPFSKPSIELAARLG
jgi:alkanesulfonate monooxygenase SsuD/methylene tetrahydromethanopterin reductase-like flavin-dependent oxidoreductase (luciferase family)